VTIIPVPDRDVLGVRAPNPSPFTLTGTNTWIVARDPAWLIDPGPEIESHLDALATAIAERGGLGGIALTHDHPDHAAAVGAMLERFPGTPVGAARGSMTATLDDGSTFGPLEAVYTPGHATDHLTYVAGDVAFTGDAVLGTGSVFIAPDPGALAAYLAGLRRLRDRALAVICPGHGPLVEDPGAKIDEYVSHRLGREQRLLAALAAGRRTVDELLDEVWSDAPAMLRPAAAVTLEAHLDKLAGEGRLPDGVERIPWSGWPGSGSARP
jgi:glyoxylase-like metal-dependent hydrolase (beta-lactamase superfamily II)